MKLGLICCVTLLSLLLPLSLGITFQQNDDWVYYRMVANFLSGHFTLDPISAPTFYSQGIPAALFAFVFGLGYLPVLTLIVSVGNFYLLYLILVKFCKRTELESILLALLFFFNPLHIYSLLGFMTENYFVFYTLLSVYFFLRYQDTKKRTDLLMYLGLALLTVLCKQAGLFIVIGFLITDLLASYKNKLLNYSIVVHFFGAIAILFYYFLLFPKTDEMLEKSLQFQYILDLELVFTLLFGIGVVVTAFILPLVVLFILKHFSTHKSMSYFLTFLVVFLITSWLVSTNFKPQMLSWGEFPYFQNTFERTGFFPRGIHGTKYYFKWSYDLYKYWDIVSKTALVTLLAVVLTGIILKKFKFVKLSSLLFLILVYLMLMLLTAVFYDRYILVLVPLVITLLSANLPAKFNKKSLMFLTAFIFTLAYLSYLFAMDFYKSNTYIWNKSLEYSKVTKPSKILGTNAWKMLYLNPMHSYDYLFSFDTQAVNDDLKTCYTPVERYKIEFPLNIFVNPYVYLYKYNKGMCEKNL